MSIERLDLSDLDEVYRQQRLNRIPRGCDQQGRHPQAAEACTELGADDEDPLRAARGVVWGVVAALMIWAAIVLASLSLASIW